ncbi:Core-2/I-branching beta-1-6-N-acetylglucosaminyltransferase family protein [Striga hermonthica]|uniref:Core-2/I-branching beta-1-6-N-acetylglucosaminyltransferase family protein n=1 Tax=Striga hermonthica TaxID=68872 RepID=A0A9N7RCD8_STRHE|nr:Core-2/I-branching beta-1-6-N-acetylglucosaminyltransferase family protein [Striga hermonthica]
MFSPTPLSILRSILLCLPLAVIFTFIAPSTTTTTSSAPSSGGAAAAPPFPTPTSSTSSTNKSPNPVLLPPRKTLSLKPEPIKNQTAAAKSTTPPTPRSQPQSAVEDDDKDDVSLLHLASRVDPNPKPVEKLAFMFLTTTHLPFAPLWESYFARAPKSEYNIYVHADPRFNRTANFPGVFSGRVIRSKPTRRHTPTLAAAARRLLAHALLHDESNSMFLLLSPSCVPIHSFRFTRRFLAGSNQSFIEILKDEPRAYVRWAARGVDAMLPEVEFADFRIGSQFWAVVRRHARDIVGDTRLWSKFRLPCLEDATCYPEEHYFPTLMSMVDPSGCVPCTLTHVDWRGGHGGHPRMYKADEVGRELIMGLRSSRPRYGDEGPGGSNSTVGLRRRDPFLFARKFSPACLDRLMAIADDVLFKD